MRTQKKKKPKKSSQKTKSLKIPAHLDEKVVFEAIEKVLNQLAPGFTFAFYDVEDIKQQGRIFALESLKKYNPSRKLDGFLFSVIKSRLINFRRDNFKRNDPPCKECHVACQNGSKSKHPGGSLCDKYLVWFDRNNLRQNIMKPVSIHKHQFTSHGKESNEPEIGPDFDGELLAQAQELANKIDLQLPAELRETYLKMKSGLPVSNVVKEKVKMEIRKILGEDLTLEEELNA